MCLKLVLSLQSDTLNREAFVIPEFSWRHAHDLPEGLGKLAAVVIAAFSGNVEDRAVSFLEESCSREHFLRADVGINGIPVDIPEALFELRRRNLKLCSKLVDRVMLTHVGADIGADLLGKAYL